MESTKRDLSVGMGEINIILLPVILGMLGVMLGITYLILGTISSEGFMDLHIFFPAFFIGIIVHEALHGFTWMKAGNIPASEIKYGVQWSTLTPYAHSKIPMKKSAYVLGAAMPGILLGILPFVIGLIIGNMWAVWFGIIFTTAAGGDLWIIWSLRNESNDVLVLDHSSQAGCYVFDEPVYPESTSAPV